MRTHSFLNRLRTNKFASTHTVKLTKSQRILKSQHAFRKHIDTHFATISEAIYAHMANILSTGQNILGPEKQARKFTRICLVLSLIQFKELRAFKNTRKMTKAMCI